MHAPRRAFGVLAVFRVLTVVGEANRDAFELHALQLRVHAQSHRRARAERRKQQLVGTRPPIVADSRRFVGVQRVRTDLDLLRVLAFVRRHHDNASHQVPPAARSASTSAGCGRSACTIPIPAITKAAPTSWTTVNDCPSQTYASTVAVSGSRVDT